jgi:hypothetical protein
MNRHKVLFSSKVKADSPNEQVAIYIEDRGHIGIEGIVFKNLVRFLLGRRSHHITLDHCIFDTATGWAPIRFRDIGDGMRITYNVFRNSRRGDMLDLWGGQHHLVQGNFFADDGHCLIVIRGVWNSVIRYNKFTNPRQRLIESYGTPDNLFPDPQRHTTRILFENNLFVNTRGHGTYSGMQFASVHTIIRKNIYTQLGNGMDFIGYHESTGKAPNEAIIDEHNRFYNNIVYDCGSPAIRNRCGTGVRFAATIDDYGDNLMINNIVYNNISSTNEFTKTFPGTVPPSCQIFFMGTARPERVFLLYNNIIHKQPGEIVLWEDGGDLAVKGDPGKTYTLAAFQKAYPKNAWNNIEVVPQFEDTDAFDFRLKDSSPCIDAGGPLTHTSSAGSGMEIKVKDAVFFSDGFGVIEPDVIRVGDDRATIVKVDVKKNTLTVGESLDWQENEPVSLDYAGDAPDLGVFEKGMFEDLWPEEILKEVAWKPILITPEEKHLAKVKNDILLGAAKAAVYLRRELEKGIRNSNTKNIKAILSPYRGSQNLEITGVTDKVIFAKTEEGKEISITFKGIYEPFAVKLASISKAYIQLNNQNKIHLAVLHAKDGDWEGVNNYLENINISSIEDSNLQQLATSLEFMLANEHKL